jgi:hypothetical protein
MSRSYYNPTRGHSPSRRVKQKVGEGGSQLPDPRITIFTDLRACKRGAYNKPQSILLRPKGVISALAAVHVEPSPMRISVCGSSTLSKSSDAARSPHSGYTCSEGARAMSRCVSHAPGGRAIEAI